MAEQAVWKDLDRQDGRPVPEAAIFMSYIVGTDRWQASLLPARVKDHATRDALLCNGGEASSAISIPV